jgi:uncharacterized membrane protein YbhN (UPF0104 family)
LPQWAAIGLGVIVTTQTPASSTQPLHRRVPYRLLFTLLLTGGMVYALFLLPWPEIWHALTTTNPLWICVALGFNLLIYPAGIIQWQLLASPSRHIPAGRMFEIVALSGMSNSVLTAIGGTTSAIVLLVVRGGMTSVNAISVLLVDQLLVGVAKLYIIAAAALVAPLPQIAVDASLVFSGLALLLVIAVLGLAHADGVVRRIRVPQRTHRSRGVALMRKFVRSLWALRSLKLAALTAALAVVKKSLEVGAAFGVQLAVGAEPSLPMAILTVAAVSVVTTAPIMPGSFGVYSATVLLVYQFLGYPLAMGLLAGLLLHLVELAPSLIVGYATFALTKPPKPENIKGDEVKRVDT